MRTDAPVPEHPAPPSSPASPQRIRLIDRITKARDNAQAVKDVLALCGELAEGVRNAR